MYLRLVTVCVSEVCALDNKANPQLYLPVTAKVHKGASDCRLPETEQGRKMLNSKDEWPGGQLCLGVRSVHKKVLISKCAGCRQVKLNSSLRCNCSTE